MRKSEEKREFFIWAMVSLVVLGAWGFFSWSLTEGYYQNKETLLRADLKRFEGEVSATVKTYEIFSRYIYSEIAEDEEILDIIERANRTEEENKNKLRNILYQKLRQRYWNLTQYEFRQLQFHLMNTESFLRMYEPTKYGDLLGDIRDTVRLVNETKKPVSAFEEGRTYNGFRYVYPLFKEENFIGTVEISISSASILSVLSELYQEEDFHFMIDKVAVDDKAFLEERKNYRESPFSNSFYMDKNVEKVSVSHKQIILFSEEKILSQLKERYQEQLEMKNSFAILYSYEKKDYILKFLSIPDVLNEPIAYLVSVSDTEAYRYLQWNLYKQLGLVTIIVLFFILFGFVLAFYNNKLKKLSEKDYLTGLCNRQKLYEVMEREQKRGIRYKYNLSIAMLDIDHFKIINDTYGHNWGDQVLKELSQLMQKNIRSVDTVARWGGEEFLLLLPYTDEEAAILVGEKIRKLIEEADTPKLKELTVSLGVSEIDMTVSDVSESIKKADEALYRAKSLGRNRVCGSKTNNS